MSSDTDVVYFHDGLADAPQLSGQVGVAKDALYAFLVTGFHTKTITSLTRNGTVATAVCASHNFEANRIIEISGVNEAGWNGRYRITSTQTGSFTFAVSNSLTTPATGTILAKYAPAQWTRLDDGSNVAAFRQGVTGGHYLRCDDSNAKYLKFLGYRDMTDRNNGSDQYPNGTGYYEAKSNAADSGTRKYFFAADQEQLILGIEYYPSSYSGQYALFSWGSGIPFMVGDAFCRFMIGQSNDASSSQPGSYDVFHYINYINANDDGVAGQVLAKSFDQQTGPVYFRKYGFGGQNLMGYTSPLAYPGLADLGGRIARIVMVEPGLAQDRGILPGLFQTPQNLYAGNVPHGAIWTDVAGYEGREIMIIRLGAYYFAAFDRTGPWR